jgi:hypothetical protein
MVAIHVLTAKIAVPAGNVSMSVLIKTSTDSRSARAGRVLTNEIHRDEQSLQ